jgi:hypothetical protein
MVKVISHWIRVVLVGFCFVGFLHANNQQSRQPIAIPASSVENLKKITKISQKKNKKTTSTKTYLKRALYGVIGTAIFALVMYGSYEYLLLSKLAEAEAKKESKQAQLPAIEPTSVSVASPLDNGNKNEPVKTAVDPNAVAVQGQMSSEQNKNIKIDEPQQPASHSSSQQVNPPVAQQHQEGKISSEEDWMAMGTWQKIKKDASRIKELLVAVTSNQQENKPSNQQENKPIAERSMDEVKKRYYELYNQDCSIDEYNERIALKKRLIKEGILSSGNLVSEGSDLAFARAPLFPPANNNDFSAEANPPLEQPKNTPDDTTLPTQSPADIPGYHRVGGDASPENEKKLTQGDDAMPSEGALAAIWQEVKENKLGYAAITGGVTVLIHIFLFGF